MSADRTEQPTPRRLREARLRGEVPVSRELTGAAALASGLATILGTSEASVRSLAGWTASLVAGELPAPQPALGQALWVMARLAAAPCAAAAAAALAAGMLQTRGLLALRAIRFRPGRLDPAKGLRRLASPWQAAASALAVAKTGLALGAAWLVIGEAAPDMAAAPRSGLPGAAALVARLAGNTALAIVPMLLAFGAVDLLLARRRHRASLRMTRAEVLRDHREDEGEPRHRAERRRLHRAAVASAPVSQAALVVVNPAHVAVAVFHRRGSEEAPVVLAKGLGPVAARIRAAARRAGVPIVRDVALARALYELAEVGEAIPEELYQAAAAVLVHVHGLPAPPAWPEACR